MAFNAYLYIKGQKQGDIHGSVTQKGHEGSIAIHSVSHEVLSPRDPASGLPTGKRQHKPFIILKENDKSSPLLWSALVNNENLTSVELRFFSPSIRSATGIDTVAQTYTILLTNASISNIQETMIDNQDPDNAKFPLRELVSFTYQKIQWTWIDGGITATDDWQTPAI